MRKFVTGQFVLERSIAEDKQAEYFQKAQDHENPVVIDFATSHDMDVQIGFPVPQDGNYVCNYKIYRNTVAACKGSVSELRSVLKQYWPKISKSYQMSGETIY